MEKVDRYFLEATEENMAEYKAEDKNAVEEAVREAQKQLIKHGLSGKVYIPCEDTIITSVKIYSDEDIKKLKEISMFYIKKAHKEINNAQDNKHIDPNLSISRAYYSMFYAAQSVLFLEDETNIHSHRAVRVKFSELFVKTGEFSKDVFRTMKLIKKLSYQADYDIKTIFTKEEAERYINYATIFIEHVEIMIEKRLKNTSWFSK